MTEPLVSSHSKKVALPPGELIHVGAVSEVDTAAAQLSVIAYDEETHHRAVLATFDEARDCMRRGRVSWLNVSALCDTALVKAIGDAFGIHSLTLEDILHTAQRPKVEFFDDYIYFVLKMITYDANHHELDTEQVSLILVADHVITFQERPGDVLGPLRARIEQGKGRIRKQGADYLFYAILDVIVDHYFLSLEGMGEYIETLEMRALDQPAPSLAGELHGLKRELLLLRRATWPLREQITMLLREEHPLVTRDITLYLRDLYDHTIQVIDTVETLRDMVSGLLDVYLSSLSNRMNDVMRVLTIIATVFIPLTFIAGVYGMNFEYMPELHYPWGYPVVLGGCAALAVGMVVWFRRKGWL